MSQRLCVMWVSVSNKIYDMDESALFLDSIKDKVVYRDFKELNIILKGDVDGSVEALSDSFQKLSTDEVHINIVHKGAPLMYENEV